MHPLGSGVGHYVSCRDHTPGTMVQGYKLGAYDVLFATNVLHATRDMGNTLQHCKALLRKGGLLIANELTTKTEFLTLTFGLTDGWWLYDDVERRIPGSPILSRHAVLPLPQSCVPQVEMETWSCECYIFAYASWANIVASCIFCGNIWQSSWGDLCLHIYSAEGHLLVTQLPHRHYRCKHWFITLWQAVVEGANGGAGV